ncbi:hypothetical protein [Cesiribacter sp. SM1]|uniref:hypothetical protein n=1 Tax=Cesiribacter sp. SM1 TaxID=2861196 RepID=UPI001CD2C459|nr:hypothetical protein [Cesiribacter sp. SM1]
MEKLTPNQVTDFLQDVRASYRLLYQYQRRVLDLARFIGDYYGCKYNGGYPKFSQNTPRRGKGNLENWAWDWLNLYFYEFNFEKPQVGVDAISFAVYIQSDTGYYDAKNIGDHSFKLSEDAFAPVNISATRLLLVVGKNIWKNNDLLHEANLKSTQKEGIIEVDGKQASTYFKAYDLQQFFNEESSRKALADFSKSCSTHGIPFEPAVQMTEE